MAVILTPIVLMVVGILGPVSISTYLLKCHHLRKYLIGILLTYNLLVPHITG